MEKTIKVVGVISSMNRNGNTATLVREALKGAEKCGAVVEEIYLPEKKIEFCQGCLRCMSTGKCHINDDFENIKEKIRAADGLILSSPTYCAAPSATIKNLFDRLGVFEYATSSVLGGKYVAAIATAGSFGAKQVVGYLSGIVRDSLMVKGYVCGNLAIHLKSSTVHTLSGVLKRAELLGSKLTQDIKRKNRYPFQNFIMRVIIDNVIKPNFMKVICHNAKGSFKGVYENLLNRTLIGTNN